MSPFSETWTAPHEGASEVRRKEERKKKAGPLANFFPGALAGGRTGRWMLDAAVQTNRGAEE